MNLNVRLLGKSPGSVLTRLAPLPAGNMTVVQALRGLAALWVVLFHASEGGHLNALLAVLPGAVRTPIFDWGHYGVAIFFALSGFVIAHSLRGAEVDGQYFTRFVLRRSIRLDPPYWGVILICIATGWLSAEVKDEGFEFPGVSAILVHLLYLQMILQLPPINDVFWTLTYEVQFYLVLCLSFYIKTVAERRGYLSSSAVIFAVMFGTATIGAVGQTDMFMPGFFVHLWYAFFLGALAYWGLRTPGYRIAFVALLAVVIFPFGRVDDSFGLFSAGAAVLLFAAGMTGWLYQGLGWSWLQFLGLISYSLYLLHNPVTGIVGFLVRRVAGESIIANLVSLGLIVFAAVSCAAVYFYAVERPCHRISRHIKVAT